ncbi:HAD family phosphatase [uncultured Parolsenella sp.]|uniref:HAD family hydrolase n=1 Tax=uncultured Parolsenella sp. TaxID=2083008 RepID=UPI0027DE34D0|nr:HAD family phosphatase [uncultured Parolsenella sp.]
MARPEKIDCVLFDCDGVIVDSEPIAAERNVKVYHMLGVPVTYEDALTLCGKSADSIPPLAAKYGKTITLGQFTSAMDAACDRGELSRTIYLEPDMRVMPGVRELIARLRSAGLRTGLVSSTVSPHVLCMLDRFGLASSFDVIITGDMVDHHKPDPEPYLTAMRYLDTTPERCVVVEDSPTGIAAGVASGAYVLGFCGSIVKQDVSAANEPLESYADFDLA